MVIAKILKFANIFSVIDEIFKKYKIKKMRNIRNMFQGNCAEYVDFFWMDFT